MFQSDLAAYTPLGRRATDKIVQSWIEVQLERAGMDAAEALPSASDLLDMVRTDGTPSENGSFNGAAPR